MNKSFNRAFSISIKDMEQGSLKFNFRPVRNRFGKVIQAINEIRYSVTGGDDKVWIVLPRSMLLSFIVCGFETGVMICFQHRVTTEETGTTEWGRSGEIEIIVNSEQITVNSANTVNCFC